MERFKNIGDFLSYNNIPIGDDGIYSSPDAGSSDQQAEEKKLRESVANLEYENYLEAISQSHSIPVMDREVKRFVDSMPYKAKILDIGGCWGWHWRKLAEYRPDIEVVIVDFVRSNLNHAKTVLGSLVGSQIYLMQGDATALPFNKGINQVPEFDGIWTVQVFQHIPDFEQACSEAYRVLRTGGKFANYSLHITPLNRFLYKLLGKTYFLEGIFNNQFYLKRANDEQKKIIEKIFGNVNDRYTECFFHPDFKIHFTGRLRSWIGRLDSYFSELSVISKLIGRQRSFEAIKN
jgi:ubiquinone/menaquinone biosynthesis C-methylase UbiE